MLRYLLLALLDREPRHGYDLKAVFEDFLGGTWPLNIGQVYTALARLEQDGLVSCEVVAQDLLPDRKVYSLTEDGRQELKRWTEEPAAGPVRLRDELFLKVMARSLLRRSDPLSLVWRQRESHMQALAQLTAMRDDPALHPSTALLLDGAILRTEADLKWLDLCEERMSGDGGEVG